MGLRRRSRVKRPLKQNTNQLYKLQKVETY